MNHGVGIDVPYMMSYIIKNGMTIQEACEKLNTYPSTFLRLRKSPKPTVRYATAKKYIEVFGERVIKYDIEEVECST